MSKYRLSRSAQRDIATLLARTKERFGEIGRRRYRTLLTTALRDIAADAGRRGSAARPELGDGVRSYHVRRSRDRARTADGVVARPRHLVLYRLIRPGLVGIGRILHDAMEIERHLPDDYGDE
jgi:toxin ParE1/3/4